MIKTIIFSFLFSFLYYIGICQYKKEFESLKHELAIAKEDTNRVIILNRICNQITFFEYDSAIYYGQQALALARQIKFSRGEAWALINLGFAQQVFNNFPVALKLLLSAEEIAEKNNLAWGKADAAHFIGLTYYGMGEYSKAIISLKRAMLLYDALHDDGNFIISENELGTVFLEMNQLDSALYYIQIAYNEVMERKVNWPSQYILKGLGLIQDKKGNSRLALDYFHQGLVIAYKEDNYISSARFNIEIAKLFSRSKNYDSCIYYAKKSFSEAQKGGYLSDIANACDVLTDVYAKEDPQQALQYSKLASTTKASIYSFEKTNAFKNIIDFEEQETKSAVDRAKKDYRNMIRQYAFLGGLVILLLIAFILYRNNLSEKKTKRQLQKKNKVIEQTLAELKSTQSQLIQSEKMASLGELTAGIAHEIQNPLNFVNNFSEVNEELLTEMKDEIIKGNTHDALILANDAIENQKKINHHGRRADSIVKGMLQHSRNSSGVKESTDINALADEYLRLSYHGLRAKDNSFDVTLRRDFDKTIEKIFVIPQEIGRVLLNLYNNAFYAVFSKALATADEAYEPTVSVSTKKIQNTVEIKVKDNGNGIPQKVLDKIFQPFFTTKPTGEGTGLGLSLAYDIVKAHEGELKVETKEGESTEFTIRLPTD